MRIRKKKKPGEPVPQPSFDEPEDRLVSQEEKTMQRYKERINSPLTAIRAHCVECMGGSVHEVAKCISATCSLHMLRMGTNAFDKRVQRRMEQADECE